MDALLAFRYNKQAEWAFKTKKTGSWFISEVKNSMRQVGATEEEIDSAIKLSIPKAYPEYVLKVDPSKTGVLTQERIELFLNKAIQKGSISTSITLAAMRERPGLTTKEIKELAEKL